MKKVVLGSTGIVSGKNAFGALPIQRVGMDEAVRILRKAYDGGITFFDTARVYTDSEEKMAQALADVRKNIVIASKSMAKTPDALREDLETSLELLKTDYLDLYQIHNPNYLPRPDDGIGLYEVMLQAKAEGLVRHIGFTSHKLPLATDAVQSGLYETLQFPFCYLSGEKDIELVRLCEQKQVGFIAMKGLSGGMLTNARACYAFMAQFGNVLPIWGIQRESELDLFLECAANPPVLEGALQAEIDADRAELADDFCRGCGYCMPCPAEIPISMAARMNLLLRRMPHQPYLEEDWQEKMRRIEGCTQCGHCRENCPYGLEPTRLLARAYEDYKDVLAGRVSITN